MSASSWVSNTVAKRCGIPIESACNIVNSVINSIPYFTLATSIKDFFERFLSVLMGLQHLAAAGDRSAGGKRVWQVSGPFADERTPDANDSRLHPGGK
jgi:hypothetical protein